MTDTTNTENATTTAAAGRRDAIIAWRRQREAMLDLIWKLSRTLEHAVSDLRKRDGVRRADPPDCIIWGDNASELIREAYDVAGGPDYE